MRQRLSHLEATFIGEIAVVDGSSQWREIPSVEGAQGLQFICPECHNETIVVPFSNPRNAPVIPGDALPGITHRWNFSGDTIDAVTITPSIDLSKRHPSETDAQFFSLHRCKWHGFVTNGVAE